MKICDLNSTERKHYYNDSDIFNIRPPKTPERYRIKNYLPSKILNNNNCNIISTDVLPIHKNKVNQELNPLWDGKINQFLKRGITIKNLIE